MDLPECEIPWVERKGLFATETKLTIWRVSRKQNNLPFIFFFLQMMNVMMWERL